MITTDYANEDDGDDLYLLFSDWDGDDLCSREVFDASFDRLVSGANNMVLVAREGERLVGYAQIIACDELGFNRFYEVAALLVAKTERSRGIGRMLMERVEAIARANGIREIKLSSQVFRSRAHVFYEGLGFEFYKISKFYAKKVV